MRGLSSLEQNLLRRSAVGDILVRSAARHPNRRVLRFRDKTYTFRELNDAVNRCAHGLMKLGIEKGDRAAIVCHNCDHYLIYWWALMKIGAVITPVNWMLRGEEIKYIVDHSGSKILCVEDALIPNVLDIKDKVPSVRTFGYINLTGARVPEGWMNIEELWRDEYPAVEPEVEINHDDLAALLYTSGTEAAPKGVMNTHLNFVSSMASAQVDILIAGNVSPHRRQIRAVAVNLVALFVAGIVAPRQIDATAQV